MLAKKAWHHTKTLGVHFGFTQYGLCGMAVQTRKFCLLVFSAFQKIRDGGIKQKETDQQQENGL